MEYKLLKLVYRLVQYGWAQSFYTEIISASSCRFHAHLASILRHLLSWLYSFYACVPYRPFPNLSHAYLRSDNNMDIRYDLFLKILALDLYRQRERDRKKKKKHNLCRISNVSFLAAGLRLFSFTTQISIGKCRADVKH